MSRRVRADVSNEFPARFLRSQLFLETHFYFLYLLFIGRSFSEIFTISQFASEFDNTHNWPVRNSHSSLFILLICSFKVQWRSSRSGPRVAAQKSWLLLFYVLFLHKKTIARTDMKTLPSPAAMLVVQTREAKWEMFGIRNQHGCHDVTCKHRCSYVVPRLLGALCYTVTSLLSVNSILKKTHYSDAWWETVKNDRIIVFGCFSVTIQSYPVTYQHRNPNLSNSNFTFASLKFSLVVFVMFS